MLRKLFIHETAHFVELRDIFFSSPDSRYFSAPKQENTENPGTRSAIVGAKYLSGCHFKVLNILLGSQKHPRSG